MFYKCMPAFLAPPLLCVAGAITFASAATALPAPGDFADVPARTSLSFEHGPTGIHVGSANENDPRPGLSTVKLYIADYALQHGDGSPTDRDLAARMIRASDDGAAAQLDAKYPQAIDAVAAEYGLTSTKRGDGWGSSYTSTADTVRFLEAKNRDDPAGLVLGAMKTPSPVAADGTDQNWGTSRLADVTGTKWGWADDGSSVVASASIGDGFSVAANTYGSPEMQTDDVLNALAGVDLSPPTAQLPTPVTIFNLPTFDELFAMLAPR